MKATTDLSKYGSSAGWIEFGSVEGLTLTGGGTFDGQGAKAWPYNNCPTHSKCILLPTVGFKTYTLSHFIPVVNILHIGVKLFSRLLYNYYDVLIKINPYYFFFLLVLI